MSNLASIQEMYPDPGITRGYRYPSRFAGANTLPSIDTEQIRMFLKSVNWKHAAIFAAIGYFLGGRRR